MSVPEPAPRPRRARISDLLTRMAAGPAAVGGKLTLDELSQRAGPRGPAFMLLFFCILSMIFSIVPGASVVISLPVLLLSWNLVLGRRRLKLPRWLGQRGLDPTLLAQGMLKRLALVRGIERLMKPRLRVLCTQPFLRLSGTVGIVCAAVLAMPIPLMNLPPTLAVFLIALGILGRDGLFILAGYVVAGLMVTAVIAMAILVPEALQGLWHFFGMARPPEPLVFLHVERLQIGACSFCADALGLPL